MYRYKDMKYNFNPENFDELREKLDSTVVYAGSYEDTPENADIVIEEGIEEIAECAFRDFENLRSVTLPASLRRISGSRDLRR